VVITAVLDGEPGAIVPTTTVHRPIREVLDFEDGVWSLTHKKGRSPKTIARVERGRKDVGRTFVMPYNGEGSGLTGRSIDRPIATITAADRWALVDGDRMRMLTIKELRAAMGFPPNYVLPPKREDATRCLGNAMCPAMAEAAVRSVAEAPAPRGSTGRDRPRPGPLHPRPDGRGAPRRARAPGTRHRPHPHPHADLLRPRCLSIPSPFGPPR
jgi:DNA (cytosine-5)-methyltransferase 1